MTCDDEGLATDQRALAATIDCLGQRSTSECEDIPGMFENRLFVALTKDMLSRNNNAETVLTAEVQLLKALGMAMVKWALLAHPRFWLQMTTQRQMFAEKYTESVQDRNEVTRYAAQETLHDVQQKSEKVGPGEGKDIWTNWESFTIQARFSRPEAPDFKRDDKNVRCWGLPNHSEDRWEADRCCLCYCVDPPEAWQRDRPPVAWHRHSLLAAVRHFVCEQLEL